MWRTTVHHMFIYITTSTRPSTRHGVLPVKHCQELRMLSTKPWKGPPIMAGGHPASRSVKTRGKSCWTKRQKKFYILQWNTEGVRRKKDWIHHKTHWRGHRTCIYTRDTRADTLEARFKIRGYQTFRYDKERHMGGIMTLIQNEIAAKETDKKTLKWQDQT